MRCANLLLKSELLLPVLERVSEETGTGKDLVILSLDSHVLYGCMEEDVMLMVEAADFNINNPTKISLVHFASRLKSAELMPTELRALSRRHDSVEPTSFHLSMAMRFQWTQVLSRNVKPLFGHCVSFPLHVTRRWQEMEERSAV